MEDQESGCLLELFVVVWRCSQLFGVVLSCSGLFTVVCSCSELLEDLYDGLGPKTPTCFSSPGTGWNYV